MKLAISSKRVQIDKSNTTVVAVAAIGAAITIFCLVASKSLLDQRSFQSRVIEKKGVALEQLKANVEETTTLVASYQAFVDSQQNVIGGSKTGSEAQDGDNAQIVLDALPSKYDFPAVITSVEKMLEEPGLRISAINGVDDELAQVAVQEAVDPEPVAIPFSFEVLGSYDAVKLLVSKIQKSIRPIQVRYIELSGNNEELTFQVKANTYYQPEKIVDIKKETIQ